MKYCIRKEIFGFNPRKVDSIEEAYYGLDDYDGKVVALFETKDEAVSALKKCNPVYYGYSYNYARAEVYMITECDWYYDDEHYRDEVTGDIVRDDTDLELFDDIIVKAAERDYRHNMGIYKYCVRICKFDFDPTEADSIEDAYYDLDDGDTTVVALFDTEDEAEEYLKKCSPVYRIVSDDKAHAEVYMITECDWELNDYCYVNEETGNIERTYSDLEFFDDVSFKAAE